MAYDFRFFDWEALKRHILTVAEMEDVKVETLHYKVYRCGAVLRVDLTVPSVSTGGGGIK